jgi:DNA-binding MarR family transcriptional regulator
MSGKAFTMGTSPEPKGTIGAATAKSRRSTKIRDVFGENYLDYQYRFVEFFVEHLEDVSRAFRGDLQQMLILAIIGQVTLRAARDAGIRDQDPSLSNLERPGISASRIADVTAIPRQTVRRKLELLRQKGWITQLPNNSWTMCHRDGISGARVDLNEVDQRAIDRIARLFTDLEALVNTCR